jgi:DNA-binding beta-propeller fold protein YncE
MQRKHLAAAAAALALAGGALSAPAGAADPSPKPKANTLVGGLVSPLSVAVSDDGTVYYSQNFAGTLHAKKPGKKARTIFTAPTPGTEVGAVSERQGSLRFALTLPAPEGSVPDTVLMGVGNNGKARALANLSAYEANRNPDAKVEYGFESLPEGCEVPPFLQPYTGIVESHPYATAQTNGRTYIADAAGNSILKYGREGKLSTVAVLPRVGVTVSAEAATALELPECVAGEKVFLEPVPTDVEVGPGGQLYVSTLPGGPEDASLGLNAAVYRIDPQTGKVRKVAGGLLSATGVAVDARGNLFVAELFRGRIAKIKAGSSKPTRYLSPLMPGDVDLRKGGDLYATTQVLVGPEGPEDPTPPGGQVVRISR